MEDSLALMIKTDKQRIAYITKIFESMGHLAIVTTMNREAGLLRLLYTAGSQKMVLQVLQSLPCTQIIE